MCYFNSLWILIIVPFKCISSTTDRYFPIIIYTLTPWKAKEDNYNRKTCEIGMMFDFGFIEEIYAHNKNFMSNKLS